MKTSLLLCAALLSLSTAAFAADDHAHGNKPLHGGVVTEASHIEFELVTGPGAVTLHIRDHGKPVATDGGTARVTWLVNGKKTEADLTPAGENRLAVQGAFPTTPGTKVVALVKLQKRRAISARFVLP